MHVTARRPDGTCMISLRWCVQRDVQLRRTTLCVKSAHVHSSETPYRHGGCKGVLLGRLQIRYVALKSHNAAPLSSLACPGQSIRVAVCRAIGTGCRRDKKYSHRFDHAV